MPSIQHPDHPMLRLLQQLFGFLATCALQQRCTGFLVVEMSQFPGHLAGRAMDIPGWRMRKLGRNSQNWKKRKESATIAIYKYMFSITHIFIYHSTTDIYRLRYCILWSASDRRCQFETLAASHGTFSDKGWFFWIEHPPLGISSPTNSSKWSSKSPKQDMYVLYQALYNLYQFQTSPSIAIASPSPWELLDLCSPDVAVQLLDDKGSSTAAWHGPPGWGTNGYQLRISTND